MSLTLKNPHAILAAIEQRPTDVQEVRLPQRSATHAWEDVEEAARLAGVRLATKRPPKPTKRRQHDAKTGREGSGEAIVSPRESTPEVELLADAQHRAKGRGLWLAFDQLQDPHNLGAIFRTAAFFGVQGALLTADRSAPLSSVVYDTSAGGIEHVPFCIETNLSRSLDAAKEAGIWVLGTSEHATKDVSDVSRDRPWLLVIGNEGAGMRRLTEEHCDEVCSIKPRGVLGSLNASVAAGILIAQLTAPA